MSHQVRTKHLKCLSATAEGKSLSSNSQLLILMFIGFQQWLSHNTCTRQLLALQRSIKYYKPQLILHINAIYTSGCIIFI